MGRILVAIGFWTLAVWLASSHYALGVAIPLLLLLGAIGLKFFALGMSVRIFLIGVGGVWSLLVLATAFEGGRLFLREQVDQACRQWAVSISLIGVAITFVVAIQSARASWDYINNGTAPAVEAGSR